MWHLFIKKKLIIRSERTISLLYACAFSRSKYRTKETSAILESDINNITSTNKYYFNIIFFAMQKKESKKEYTFIYFFIYLSITGVTRSTQHTRMTVRFSHAPFSLYIVRRGAARFRTNASNLSTSSQSG